MNILFLTLLDFDSIEEYGIYTDLLREFTRHGHTLFIISPVEKRKKETTHVITSENVRILKLKIGNIQKTNIIEKGISTITIEPEFIYGIKKYFSNIKFDLVLYSTPPITFCKAVEFVKNRDKAKTYLLLKDIFPQNAVDIGILSTVGVKGLLYKFFRVKEKKLYALSDYIGCMSQKNMDYILKHNQFLSSRNVEVCPNSIEVIDKSVSEVQKRYIREKYNIPLRKKVFVYGGNLGKPQGVDFIAKCLKTQKNNEKVFFLIIGDGTEYKKLERFIRNNCLKNVKLMARLPKDDYDSMVGACDVGMIFLDYRFTIPNFPSRILSYMQAKLPVLAATDANTDVGEVIVDGGFGWWCESSDVKNFEQLVNISINADLVSMGEKGYGYLLKNYSIKKTYLIIDDKLRDRGEK